MKILCIAFIINYRSLAISNITTTSTSRNSKSGISSSKVSEAPLVFSFKYLDTTNNKFHIEHKNIPYVLKMLEQLQNLSTMKLSEAKTAGNALRFHSIDFSDTKVSEKTIGIRDSSLMADSCAYQFQLSLNKGRVIGFVVANTFYIKWLDPEHNLYPTRGITLCKRGKTNCDKQLEEKDKKILEYEELLDELTTKPQT